MGSLSNLYISQSYQSLAHLGTNNALVPGTMTVLQDGLGNSLNISFDGTNISSSGNIYAANITGSGGGGARNDSDTSNVVSGSGGSGVVIVRVLTANYTAVTTGSPTVTTSGSDTIMKFTTSGSYTA